MSGRRIAYQGLIGSVAVWAALVVFCMLRSGTHWPRAVPAVPAFPQANFPGRPGLSAFDAWWTFLRICFVVEFLAVKSWAMARRTREIDALGVSLIAANVAFAVVYAWTIGVGLFAWDTPYWVREYVIADPLVVVLAIGFALLCRLPDEPEAEPVPEPEPAPVDRLVWEGPNRRGEARGRRATDR